MCVCDLNSRNISDNILPQEAFGKNYVFKNQSPCLAIWSGHGQACIKVHVGGDGRMKGMQIDATRKVEMKEKFKTW